MNLTVCDRCQTPTQNSDELITWRSITPTVASGIGLEMSVIDGGKATGTVHLCEEHFAELMLSCLLTFKETNVVQQHYQMKRSAAAAADAHRTLNEIAAERDHLRVALDKAKDLASDAARYDLWKKTEKELNEKIEDLKQKLLATEIKLSNTERAAAERQRLAAAAEKQAALDGDYLASVAKREALRASGGTK
jgi:hypothetical protein